jgi:hypothetical protein
VRRTGVLSTSSTAPPGDLSTKPIPPVHHSKVLGDPALFDLPVEISLYLGSIPIQARSIHGPYEQEIALHDAAPSPTIKRVCIFHCVITDFLY